MLFLKLVIFKIENNYIFAGGRRETQHQGLNFVPSICSILALHMCALMHTTK